PLAIMLFPIERRLPILLLDFLPTGGIPPAKILITAGVNKFEIVFIAHGSAVEQEVLQKDLMFRLLVIERESERRHLLERPHPLKRRHPLERPHPCGRFTGSPAGLFVTK